MRGAPETGRHVQEIIGVAEGQSSRRDADVLASWRRCVNDYRLDPGRASGSRIEGSLPAALRSIHDGDAAMQRLAERTARVVDHRISVILRGETGTGKEFIARANPRPPPPIRANPPPRKKFANGSGTARKQAITLNLRDGAAIIRPDRDPA